MYDLKKKNQELEKFKFVLDYKIKELRKQIEPRENEIKEMRDQIQEVSHSGKHKHGAGKRSGDRPSEPRAPQWPIG